MRPRINGMELEEERGSRTEPPYDFEAALDVVRPYLGCVHVSGCGGARKEIHEGEVPGEDGDRVVLLGLLSGLEDPGGGPEIPVVIEICDGHTEAGFARVKTALERVSAALDQVRRG